MQPDLIRIGRFQKTFGTRGALILDLVLTDIEPQVGIPVLLAMAETRVPFFIEEVQARPDGRYQLLLDGIENPEQAARIVNAEVYLERKYLPAGGDDQLFITELIGYAVTDEQEGSLGSIRDMLAYPEQDMMEIEDLHGRVFLLPLVEAYLTNIDEERRELRMDCPPGLIKLIRGKD